jgi:hypothetical protein
LNEKPSALDLIPGEVGFSNGLAVVYPLHEKDFFFQRGVIEPPYTEREHQYFVLQFRRQRIEGMLGDCKIRSI